MSFWSALVWLEIDGFHWSGWVFLPHLPGVSTFPKGHLCQRQAHLNHERRESYFWANEFHVLFAVWVIIICLFEISKTALWQVAWFIIWGEWCPVAGNQCREAMRFEGPRFEMSPCGGVSPSPFASDKNNLAWDWAKKIWSRREQGGSFLFGVSVGRRPEFRFKLHRQELLSNRSCWSPGLCNTVQAAVPTHRPFTGPGKPCWPRKTTKTYCQQLVWNPQKPAVEGFALCVLAFSGLFLRSSRSECREADALSVDSQTETFAGGCCVLAGVHIELWRNRSNGWNWMPMKPSQRWVPKKQPSLEVQAFHGAIRIIWTPISSAFPSLPSRVVVLPPPRRAATRARDTIFLLFCRLFWLKAPQGRLLSRCLAHSSETRTNSKKVPSKSVVLWALALSFAGLGPLCGLWTSSVWVGCDGEQRTPTYL